MKRRIFSQRIIYLAIVILAMFGSHASADNDIRSDRIAGEIICERLKAKLSEAEDLIVFMAAAANRESDYNGMRQSMVQARSNVEELMNRSKVSITPDSFYLLIELIAEYHAIDAAVKAYTNPNAYIDDGKATDAMTDLIRDAVVSFQYEVINTAISYEILPAFQSCVSKQ